MLMLTPTTKKAGRMNRKPETNIAGHPPNLISETTSDALVVKLFTVLIPESNASIDP
jgi:hypothetical protein